MKQRIVKKTQRRAGKLLLAAYMPEALVERFTNVSIRNRRSRSIELQIAVENHIAASQP